MALRRLGESDVKPRTHAARAARLSPGSLVTWATAVALAAHLTGASCAGLGDTVHGPGDPIKPQGIWLTPNGGWTTNVCVPGGAPVYNQCYGEYAGTVACARQTACAAADAVVDRTGHVTAWYYGSVGTYVDGAGASWNSKPEAGLFLPETPDEGNAPVAPAVVSRLAALNARARMWTLATKFPRPGIAGIPTLYQSDDACRAKSVGGTRYYQCVETRTDWRLRTRPDGCAATVVDLEAQASPGETITRAVRGVVTCREDGGMGVMAFGNGPDGGLKFGVPDLVGDVTVHGVDARDRPVRIDVKAGVPADLGLSVTVHAGDGAQGGKSTASAVVVISPD